MSPKKQTRNGQRINDSGDDQVGQGEIGDEDAPGVVAGGLRPLTTVSKVLHSNRRHNDQVAESSNDGCDTKHRDVRTGDDRPTTVQRLATADRRRRSRTVHLDDSYQRKLHLLQIFAVFACRICSCHRNVEVSPSRSTSANCSVFFVDFSISSVRSAVICWQSAVRMIDTWPGVIYPMISVVHPETRAAITSSTRRNAISCMIVSVSKGLIFLSRPLTVVYRYASVCAAGHQQLLSITL